MSEIFDKQRWRDRARTERSSRTIDSPAHCRAVGRFLAETLDEDAVVVVYDALSGEVDLAPLIRAEAHPERRFAITRTPCSGHDLTVHGYGCEMERHRYGFAQPKASAPTVADEDIGAVLVPGLAFDRSGVRLGRGQGYYDRFLARLLAAGSAAARSELVLVGMTGDYIVERLPSDSFDVSMTHLATEGGVHPVAAEPQRDT